MAARPEKRKLAKNPPITKYNLDPTTPIHRQSLATVSAPTMVETKQPKSTPQLHYAILDQPQRSELPLNRNKSEHKGQSDWMVPFCHHPVGDHATAFTGIFAPCVLYGKTHWRLKNVSLGRDPHDFKSSDGCNSMCWIHGALTVACFGLTVIQRARIRAQYRIQGSMGNDVIKSCFCCPCAMMQHDREVRAREGDVGLAKNFGGPQMYQIQPKAPQPMRYALPRNTLAEDPGVGNRIFQQGQRRYTDSELQEVPAVAVSCAEDTHCQISNGHRSENCEVEALKDHLLMESHRRTINSSNTDANVAKTDGATSSQQKTRVGSEKKSVDTDSPIPSLYEHHLKVKGCEKLSRMPARGHLSYVHDFSDYSATKIVLDHYAEEEKRLQEKGVRRCLARFSEEKLNQLGSNKAATQSIRSSSSSTIRQHNSQEGAVETPSLDLVNKSRTDSCATGSVDAAWVLDIPAQHRISSCSVITEDNASVQKSPRQHRIVSCPTTPGTPVTSSSSDSISKDRSLHCTVETASPSSSSSSALYNEVSATKMDIMSDSDFSTTLIQYSHYCHLLDESTLKSDPSIQISSSRHRASSCTALSPIASSEQHSLGGCSALSGDSSPISVKQHRISSCYASIPSSSSKISYGENDSRLSGDCSFTTGSSTPLPPKQQILASYTTESSPISRKSSSAVGHLMEDGCLLSGAASSIKQHCVASCRENSGGQNHINTKNNFGNGYISSGSTTPKPRQHRAVSFIASSAISECEEHLLDDCQFDSKIASPLPQHNLTGCDTTSVSAQEQEHLLTVFEEEQQHSLEDCAADSSPSSPLRQHRVASCVISSASSNRNSVAKQHRVASCPDIKLNDGTGAQSLSPDFHRLPRGILIDTSENDQSTHTNYEDCLHTLDECITPADRVKMEANASRDTEYEKYSMRITNHFNEQASELNEKSAKEEQIQRLTLNDFASHESDAQFTLAQILSLDQDQGRENPPMTLPLIYGDGSRSIASRNSIAPAPAPPVPFPSPAAPYPSPITPLHISGAYPPSIPSSLSSRKDKDKRRIPSEQSSAGSAFASYFGFGGVKKSQGLRVWRGGFVGSGVGGGIGGSKRGIGNRSRPKSRSRSRSMGLAIVEPVAMEEWELEEILL